VEGIADVLSGGGEGDVWDETVVRDDGEIAATGKVGSEVCVDEAECVWGEGLVAGVEAAAVDEDEDGGLGMAGGVVYVELGRGEEGRLNGPDGEAHLCSGVSGGSVFE